ncbi:MAG: MGMT family protein [Candidatus Thermochlorobacter aerophilum]|jgi:methylated-DNA-protein-cysteine methyltransferase-like protein|uniref:MGMT family protein n=1 Tax=Candidatus Thermochlorobacter aerophilus TaxID=1868324 RepID=A0A395LYU5_9BACT|nr:MAG: MGMT family protein [Candidatus Thermochlorobacter aerophilum]
MRKKRTVEKTTSLRSKDGDTALQTQNFYAKVYALVRSVPKGKVTTYGAIAEALGAKCSARMVGYALHAAIGSDVPAHRVVNRFGALTGKHHFPHPDLMKQLLLEEGVSFNDDDTVKMEKHFYAFRRNKKAT